MCSAEFDVRLRLRKVTAGHDKHGTRRSTRNWYWCFVKHYVGTNTSFTNKVSPAQVL